MIDRPQRGTNEYLSLGLLLFLVAAVASTVVTSCGSGGGSSNGGLCEECGDDPDGPCQATVPVMGPDALAICGVDPCPSPVPLRCLRKLGSAQRRCFPFANDPFFECDGARPNPATATPGPPATPTAAGATPNPADCGNGRIDVGEECDGTNLNGRTCADRCVAGSGALLCFTDCTFDTSLCIGECVD